MISMVYKDFLVLRKQMGYYLVFVIVYAGLVIGGVFGPDILPGLTMVVGMLLPMSSMSYDDAARWDKYAAATPAGRQGIVTGKYLFCLLSVIAVALLVFLLTLALSLLGIVTMKLEKTVLASLACVGVAMLVDAVILPLLFKFGAEKSRAISMILFLAIFGGAMAINVVLENGGMLPTLPDWLHAALPMVLAMVVVGGFIISYFVARGIYEKKAL